MVLRHSSGWRSGCCIYNCIMEQKTLFSSLRREKTKNNAKHLHYMMNMVKTLHNLPCDRINMFGVMKNEN